MKMEKKYYDMHPDYYDNCKTALAHYENQIVYISGEYTRRTDNMLCINILSVFLFVFCH